MPTMKLGKQRPVSSHGVPHMSTNKSISSTIKSSGHRFYSAVAGLLHSTTQLVATTTTASTAGVRRNLSRRHTLSSPVPGSVPQSNQPLLPREPDLPPAVPVATGERISTYGLLLGKSSPAALYPQPWVPDDIKFMNPRQPPVPPGASGPTIGIPRDRRSRLGSLNRKSFLSISGITLVDSEEEREAQRQKRIYMYRNSRSVEAPVKSI